MENKYEAKFKDKVKAIKKSLKQRDKRLSDETVQKSAERIAGSMIKNESEKLTYRVILKRAIDGKLWYCVVSNSDIEHNKVNPHGKFYYQGKFKTRKEAEEYADKLQNKQIKNESIRDGWKPPIDLYTRQINEIADNLGISKNEIQKEGDSIKFRYNGKVYFAEPRAMYQVDIFDDNHNQIGWGVLTDKIKEEVFTDYITDNKFVYELVGGEYGGTYTREEAENLPIKENELTDKYDNDEGLSPRKELQRQLKFKGYLGPMWGGIVDGKAIIRYETQEVYDQLSESKKLNEIASKVPNTEVEKKPVIEYEELYSGEDLDNLGSDAELIYDMYEKLGIDIDEAWDIVGDDMDSGVLKIAHINGNSYFVYDDGETQAYCIGRASDNMPITIIGNIEDDTEIMKPVKRDTKWLDKIYNSLYGDQLNENYDEEDEFMFDKYNIRKSLAGYIKYVSDCINDKEVERLPVSFDEFFNNEYEDGYYNEEDTKFLDRYSIDELYDMASEYNDYIIECEEIGEDIKTFNDFFKLDESKKLQEDEVIDRPEDIAEEQNEEVEDEIEEDIEETTENKTILDLLEERIGQELEAGRLNAVLQSIFGMYNRTFILPTDLYNVDADEEQTLTIFDDGDEYNIYYDIIDIESGLIKITGVEIL